MELGFYVLGDFSSERNVRGDIIEFDIDIDMDNFSCDVLSRN